MTVQRVSLKRNGKTVEDIWKLANCQNGRRTPKEAVTQRGERGIRITDFNYRKAGLELGMLKGNAFVITLRCVSDPRSRPRHVIVTHRLPYVRSVKVDSMETLDKALNIVKHKGFINYYGNATIYRLYYSADQGWPSKVCSVSGLLLFPLTPLAWPS